MLDLGIVRPGSTIYIPSHYFDSNDPSASSQASGFALADVRVYKDGSTTERASTSGFTLLDTDGIDFDAVTGLNALSIDLSDNTTAGFYNAGSSYWVVYSSVTVDTATINHVAATFRIGYEGAILNTTIATLSSQTSFTLTAGSADNDAYNGCPVIVHDLASSIQVAIGYITDYVGSSKTVTLGQDPAIFVMAAGDNISLFMPSNMGAIIGNVTNATNVGTAGANYSATRGLSGTALPAAAADAAGGLPISDLGGLDLDAMNTNINDIETDTADMQPKLGTITDLGSGATIGANLVDIEAQTDDIGAAGAGLTAIPWNAAWDAEVESEVTDGLNAYDPPTRAELTSDINSVLAQLPSDAPVEGTADSGTTLTMVDAARTEADTDYWKGSFILFTSGTISGQARLITAFTPGTDTITFTPATTQAVGTNTYRIIPAAQIEEVLVLTGHTPQTGDNYARLGAPSGASVSADIAENQTDLNTILADTNELQTDWVDGGRLDLLIDSILADTNELQTDDVPGLIAALNNLSAAQVNAEVVDALATDTYAEPTGVPGATVTLAVKLGYLYMALRNRIDVNSTDKTFYDDGGLTEWKKALSDDGTTYSEAEATTP